MLTFVCESGDFPQRRIFQRSQIFFFIICESNVAQFSITCFFVTLELLEESSLLQEIIKTPVLKSNDTFKNTFFIFLFRIILNKYYFSLRICTFAKFKFFL